MPDTTPPEDLVALKRAFSVADAELTLFAGTLPSSVAVVAGEAEFTPEQAATWEQLSGARADLAVRIHQHPAFEGLAGPERLALDEAATRAAKSAG